MVVVVGPSGRRTPTGRIIIGRIDGPEQRWNDVLDMRDGEEKGQGHASGVLAQRRVAVVGGVGAESVRHGALAAGTQRRFAVGRRQRNTSTSTTVTVHLVFARRGMEPCPAPFGGCGQELLPQDCFLGGDGDAKRLGGHERQQRRLHLPGVQLLENNHIRVEEDRAGVAVVADGRDDDEGVAVASVLPDELEVCDDTQTRILTEYAGEHEIER